MINCKPYGGISNRMKCIISSIAEYDEINLIWDISQSDGGVRCEFNDLFKNQYKGKSDKTVTDCSFIHEPMNTHNFGSKEELSSEMKKKYIDIIHTLEPVDYVVNRINEEKKKLGEFICVSVRTFKSFNREHKSWGKHFNIENLYDVLRKLDGNILLTCDDNDTIQKVKERFEVYTTPKRTSFGDFKTVEGMQDILIDQYLGGLATDIYGTEMSSFSEMQWWLGKCQPNYHQMKLHKK